MKLDLMILLPIFGSARLSFRPSWLDFLETKATSLGMFVVSRLTRIKRPLLLFFALSYVAALPLVTSAQDTPDYFRQNCLSCHTIGGGRLTGPDLKDITERQPDREWLIKFIMNPTAVLASSDPYAKKIFEESRRVPMPMAPQMTRERAEKLLELIETESKLDESQFRGLQISTEPFTEEDRERGSEIFLGVRPLEAGGASCISCHSIHGLAPLGGGQLGPDLTNICERLEGRATLSAWLMAPATETMLPIFKKHPLSSNEIHSLVAYFESTAGQQAASTAGNRVAFLLSGLIGAVAIIFLFDVIWKRRFHAVRRPLVESLPKRGKA